MIFEFKNGPKVCTYDSERRELFGRDINPTNQLEPLVAELVMYFLKHPRRIILHEELLEQVWKNTHNFQEVLTSAVSKLRAALNERPKSPHAFLSTVPKAGYRFDATVYTPEAKNNPDEVPTPEDLVTELVGRNLLATDPVFKEQVNVLVKAAVHELFQPGPDLTSVRSALIQGDPSKAKAYFHNKAIAQSNQAASAAAYRHLAVFNFVDDDNHLSDPLAGAMALEEALKHDPNHVASLMALGYANSLAGEHTAAEELFRRALSLSMNNEEVAAPCHHALGYMYRNITNLDMAEHHLTIAAELYQKQEHELGLAMIQFNRASIAIFLNKYEEAIILMERISQTFIDHGIKDLVALTLNQMSAAHIALENLDIASDLLEESVRFCLRFSKVKCIVPALVYQGQIHRLNGEFEEAKASLRKASNYLDVIHGEQLGRARLLLEQARLLADLPKPRYEKACKKVLKALSIYEAANNKEGRVHAYGELAKIEHQQGNQTEAAMLARKAIELSHEFLGSSIHNLK